MIEIRRNEERRTSALKALLGSSVGFSFLEWVGGAAANVTQKIGVINPAA